MHAFAYCLIDCLNIFNSMISESVLNMLVWGFP